MKKGFLMKIEKNTKLFNAKLFIAKTTLKRNV